MSIDIEDVLEQFGRYYIANPNNMQRLRSMLYKPGETAAYFSERPGDDTQYRAVLSTLNRVVQPFQKAFTPISTISFKPNKFDLFKIKVDLSETPDDLESSYLGFLAATPVADRAQWLFVRWYLEEHLMNKIDEDMETNEYFLGEFEEPTPGVAGAAGTSMDGLRKVIRGYNTAGLTNLTNGPIVMGAPSDSNVDWCTQVEEWVEAIPKQWRNKLDYVFMNNDLELRYKKGKDQKYNTNYAQSTDLSNIKLFPNIKIIGLESHGDSELIWSTIPVNRIRPTKKAPLKKQVKIESAKRVVDILSDWWEALNFEVPQFVFHNERDLV